VRYRPAQDGTPGHQQRPVWAAHHACNFFTFAVCWSPLVAKAVSPVSRLTNVKYSQLPGVGFSADFRVSLPGELIGVGGRPRTF
jgi:hypothetical protein